jgi:CubicO group peptidase (beta-lactamase class C family)
MPRILHLRAFRSSLRVIALAVSVPVTLASQNAPQRQQVPAATRIRDFMGRAADYGQFNGAVLVVDSGRTVYEAAFGLANMELGAANTTATRFEIASMTKAMTAIAIMQLVQEGRVRLDGKISDYVPFYPRETGTRITVEQLLNHTSGIRQDIAFDEPSPGGGVVAAINGDVISNDSLVSLIARRPLRFEPGTNYGYSSDAYAVLGSIIEHVTGKPYWQALRERVLDRVGMTETGVSLLRPLVPGRAAGYAQSFDGFENAQHIGVTPAGGLYSTLGDLRRFDEALYGDTLVTARSKALLFGLRSVITAYGWKTSEDTLPNGLRRLVLRTTGGLPGFQALMVRVPDARRTIIFLSNVRTVVWRLDDFAIAIGRMLDGLPYYLPKRSAAEVIADAVRKGSAGVALEREFAAMRADSTQFAVVEPEMNRLGYHFLSRGLTTSAIDVFRLNVGAFPRSANVYDSLGEAYLARGDTSLAVTNYRKSVELDPGNTNAVNILKRIAPPVLSWSPGYSTLCQEAFGDADTLGRTMLGVISSAGGDHFRQVVARPTHQASNVLTQGHA